MPRRALVACLALSSTACVLGPNYKRPAAPVPSAFKEAAGEPAPAGGGWKTAEPADEADRGKWWKIFGDPGLDALEEQVAVSNQTIAQAEAQFRAARAGVRLARADLFPVADVGASGTRSSGVTNRAAAPANGPPPAISTVALSGELSWAPDLFGRVRRTVEASVASAQASAADLESVRLAMHAELAVDYFTLRGLDAETRLLDTTVKADELALSITTNRYKQGVVSGVDVAQAETLLETTRAQAIDLQVARAQVEHAIAVLVGRPPAELSLPPEEVVVQPPPIPLVVPSELLERRPDLAVAERRVAAANAGIGVAKAAFFPTLGLSASGGFQGTALSGLFSLPNRFWSLGGSLAETLFEGGKRRAASAQAVAAYDATVAAYRESVLGAFQEVEDGLAALRILAQEADQQAKAVAAAEHLLALSKNRYQAGITTYLEVVTAQSAALSNERTAVQLLTRRMTASVSLLGALGGGWRETDLPSPGAILARAPSPKAEPSAPALPPAVRAERDPRSAARVDRAE
ncbi:MAG TPA: efflux transporter outer membrane subunit [Vicinamibacteria bacterium]|nr:efflux transporter outer membrane subunit [Vicinamibacteria bacterium]